MKKKILLSFITGFVLCFISITLYNQNSISISKIISPVSQEAEKEKPLEKYSFLNLKNTTFKKSKIFLGEIIKDEKNYSSYLSYFYDNGKKVSGLLTTPKDKGTYPLIIQFRGYVPQENYTTGDGTRHSGEVFASKGFVTIAPDFLGYGESDFPSKDVLEARFQSYTTALTLLASTPTINSAMQNIEIQIDENKVGLWGHSNGGQIALTVLEITGKEIPTVLWAPVTKPFPYSILYYTDDADDRGKTMRKIIANFEKDYNADHYSLTNYLKWIQAPIQLHQGTADKAVPKQWSDEFVEKMQDLDKDIKYFTYEEDDHNFIKGSWNTVVNRNIQFFNDVFNY